MLGGGAGVADRLALEVRLDALFHFLTDQGHTVAISEQADAFAVAKASLNAPLDTLRARIRATVLKDVEPNVSRLFDTAFDAAFAGNPLVRAAARRGPGRRHGLIARDTVSPPEDEKNAYAPGLWLVAGVSILILLSGLYLFVMRAPSSDEPPDGLAHTLPDPGTTGPLPPNFTGTETGGQRSGETPPPEEARLSPEDALAQIAISLLAAADIERRTSLDRISLAIEHFLPLGTTREQAAHMLMLRTGLDPHLIFPLDSGAFGTLLTAVTILTGRTPDEAHYQLAENIVTAFIDTENPPTDPAFRNLEPPIDLSQPDALTNLLSLGIITAPGSPFEIMSPLLLRSITSEFQQAGDLASLASSFEDELSRFRVVLAFFDLETLVEGFPAPARSAESLATAEARRSLAEATVARLDLALPGGPYAPPAAPAAAGLRAPLSLYLFVVFLPLLIAGARLATVKNRLAAWFTRNPPPLNFDPKYNHWGGLTQAVDDAMGRDLRIRAARNLSRPILRETRRLNSRRTVEATARNLGRFDPVYAQSRINPSYLVIILRRSADDHQAQQFRELVGSLSQIGSSIDVWYMDQGGNALYRDPNTMSSIRDLNDTRFHESFAERRISLLTLWRRQPDRRVIVLGDGEIFIDSATGQPRSFVRDLRRWPYYAIMIPRLRSHWGRRETRLSRIFEGRIYEARPEGLRDLAQHAGQNRSVEQRVFDPSGSFLWESHPLILTSESRPGPEILSRLENDLTRALGSGGMRWLRAATIYPAFNWDLTIYLGKLLDDPETVSGVVYDPDRFRQMATLPWFRDARFPLWAVYWLQEGMSEDEKLLVRDLLLGMLPEAHRQPDSALNQTLFMTEGAGEGYRSVNRRHRNVFLELLATGPPEGAPLKATPELAERYAATRRRFWRRESMVIGALGGYALTAAVLAPKPWSGAALFAGDFLPLSALLVSGALTYPLLHFGAHLMTLKREAQP